MNYYFKSDKSKIITHKIKIFPTQEQIEYFNKCFGIRRFVWNKLVDDFILDETKSLGDFNRFQVQKQLNDLALTEEYSFFNEVNSMVRQECLADFEIAFRKYNNHLRYLESKDKPSELESSEDISKYRPTKKDSVQTFRYNNKGKPVKPIGKKHFYLLVNKKKGNILIKCNESLQYLNKPNIRFARIVIYRDNLNEYYACIYYERTNHKEYTKHVQDKVGIDMGIKNPYTYAYEDSDTIYADFVDIPNKLYTLDKRLAYSHKYLSSKDENRNSNNYKKQLLKVNKIYTKIKNIRKDMIYQFVSFLCKNFKTIIYEDFPVNYKKDGWKSNRKKLKHISRYSFLEHLYFKAKQLNNTLIEIPIGTPTTQTCSNCGHRFMGEDKLDPDDRIYECPDCNMVMDRDVNSAINILHYTK